MKPTYADCVMESTTTTGTGPLALSGALTGYQGFAAIGDGKECFARVATVDVNGRRTGQWESFRGTYTASGSTLSRDEVLFSSSLNGPVDFAPGTKHVILGIPAVECGPNRHVTGPNSEFIFRSTKTGTGLGGNAIRVQQTNPAFYSCLYCVGHDVADDSEGYGVAFGWGNNDNPQVFGGRAYIEAYNSLSSDFKPFALIQTSNAGNYRRYEAAADGDQVFYRRNLGWPAEAQQLRLKNNGSVVVGDEGLATDASDGFLYIPGGNGPPTGTPAYHNGRFPLYVDYANKKLYVGFDTWEAIN